MTSPKVLDQLSALLASADDTTTMTSMRLPSNLKEAAALAVAHLEAASTTTALTADALRYELETVLMQAVLDEHYRQYPDDKPTLARLAQATAALDGHSLADSPALIEAAAASIVTSHPNATPDDVLLWAEATRAARAGKRSTAKSA